MACEKEKATTLDPRLLMSRMGEQKGPWHENSERQSEAVIPAKAGIQGCWL